MSKSNNNRKGRRAAQQAERELQQIRLLNTPIRTTEDCTQATEYPHHKRDNKQEDPMGFREFFKQPYVTNWLLALFTLALTITAIYQYRITANQLDVMRNDERAWVEFRSLFKKADDGTPIFQVAARETVNYPAQVINTGKTPAKNIVASIFVEIVNASEGPHLSYIDDLPTHSHARVTSGILFPNTDSKWTIVRVDNGIPSPATVNEVIALQSNTAFVVAYGIITYDDVFNEHHWTRFCHWASEPTGNYKEPVGSPTGNYNAEGCTEFNSVDGQKPDR
jgi:hypothetical protein